MCMLNNGHCVCMPVSRLRKTAVQATGRGEKDAKNSTKINK